MKTILVAVDLSDATDPVIKAARDLAVTKDSQTYLIHVANPDPDFIGYEVGPETVRDMIAQNLQNEHTRMHELKVEHWGDDDSVTALCIQGSPAEKLLAEQEKLGADVIVVGSHGHGALHNLLTGSVTEFLLRKAPCPVVVVPVRK